MNVRQSRSPRIGAEPVEWRQPTPWSLPVAAIDTDRNLLFGLLALQTGLIGESQLVAAFQSWIRDKSRPMADLLVGRGGLDADDRDVVEALVARHIKKHGGDVEKSLAAVPAGQSTYASLARSGDLDIECTLARLGPARPVQSENPADLTETLSVGSVTSDGQRFRILRPHAEGGLGAVFLAIDQELHREVALSSSSISTPTTRLAEFVS